jgi:antirestriction protein ArdC
MRQAASPSRCGNNGTPYSGINIIMLWQAAAELGYSAAIWMTYRQARD